MALFRYRRFLHANNLAFLMMLGSVAALGQAKQMVQVKTFDQKLSPYKNLELILNGSIDVRTNDKGSTFIELNESELPVRTVEVKNDELEVASWNLSKGVIEIIVRKKNYKLVTITIVNEKQQPLEKVDISFTGLKKLSLKTSSEGTVQLPLAPDERLTSPNQFSIKGFQSVRLAPNAGNYTLTVERIPPPVEAPKQVARPVVRSYDREVASLDTVKSLAVFYLIVRNMAMDALDDEQKDRVDLKFNELLRSMQDSVSTAEAPLISITDSTEITDDIRRLMERALAERNQLELQRTEFETRIKSLDRKLSGGIADMDEATRNRLLSDITSLENLLGENQRQFDKNQAEYQQVIRSLKERYFDIKLLEEKLTVVEQLREEEQREFRKQTIIAVVALGVFTILIVLLAQFSNKMRKQKKALTLANNEIRKINESLEERVTNRTKLLQEAIVELDTFLYRASHDLRTPVASIEGVSNLADHISQHELVGMIKSSTERMNKLLKNLSVISEINQPAAPREINVKEVIDKLAGRFEALAADDNVQISWVCPDSIRLHTYPVFFEVVITKLVENALFFTRIHEGVPSAIKVSLTANEENVLLMVEDNGVGIDPGVQPRIFEMFFKGHEKSKGSGLGLYIVSRCLRLMKGSVTVNSSARQTRFTVKLPENIA